MRFRGRRLYLRFLRAIPKLSATAIIGAPKTRTSNAAWRMHGVVDLFQSLARGFGLLYRPEFRIQTAVAGPPDHQLGRQELFLLPAASFVRPQDKEAVARDVGSERALFEVDKILTSISIISIRLARTV